MTDVGPVDGGVDGPLPDGPMVDGMIDGGMGIPGCMPDEFPAPTITICDGDSIPSLADGACETTAGDANVLITGDVLLPGEVLRGGQVLIGTDGNIVCAACDCSGEAAAAGATSVVCPDGVISPGLINAHDHIGFNGGIPNPIAEEDQPERFEHRHDWRRGLDRDGDGIIHNRRPSNGGPVSREAAMWHELRMVMSGSTSTLGSNSGFGWQRNLDVSSRLEGLDVEAAESIPFPLDDGGGDNRTGSSPGDSLVREEGCDYSFGDPSWNRDTAIDVMMETGRYVMHMAEGIDQGARNEFLCAREGMDDLIQENTTLIHGVGLLPQEIGEMAIDGTILVWSPRTNIYLYGDTARVTLYHRLGVQIALGTDWIFSGSANMLRELSCAASYNENYLDGFFSDEQLWLMATRNAGAAAGMADSIGQLAAGYVGDVAIYDGRMRADHAAVIDAGAADVLLVLRGGVPLYGNSELLTPFPGTTDCEALPDVCGTNVCGTAKHACVMRESEMPFSMLMTEAVYDSALLPLCWCGEPDYDEPTCVPERRVDMGGMLPPTMVNGSNNYDGTITDTDRDGDGVMDAVDNCLCTFNPIRPLDDGSQEDADDDGIGDACDPCPLGGDDSPETCTVVDVTDFDMDGVLNEVDNCPTASNPLQEDMDDDGKGDACDMCPDVPNPGATPCPAAASTIYAVRMGDVALGTDVSLSGLVVTGVAGNGFYAQQLEGTPDYDGVAFSGIFVFTGGAPSGVARGDVIDVVRATTDDFSGSSQLTNTTWTVTASGMEVTPVVVADPTMIATGGAMAEPLESVVVEVQDVIVTNANPDAPGGDFGEFEVTGGLRVDDEMFTIAPDPVVDDEFGAIAGPLGYSFDNTKVRPRDAADVIPSGLRLTPRDVTIGTDGTIEFTVQIPMLAPAGGADVTIAIAPAGLLTGPATITVPEGSSIGSATYTASATEMMGTLTASYMGDMLVANVNVVEATGMGLFISEYVEGGTGRGGNKALELYNAGPDSVDLSTCQVIRYTNGSMDPSASVTLVGTLPALSTYLICNPGFDDLTCDQDDSVINHNGDDAYEIVCAGMVVDSFGRRGEDPGAEWSGGGVGTADVVLRRSCGVGMGDTVSTDAFDPSVEWEEFVDTDLSGFGDRGC